MTASEARRNWFRVLDRVAAGEIVVIERGGRRIVLRREEDRESEVPDYSQVIRPRTDVDRADEWSWEWREGEGLSPAGDGEDDGKGDGA